MSGFIEVRAARRFIASPSSAASRSLTFMELPLLIVTPAVSPAAVESEPYTRSPVEHKCHFLSCAVLLCELGATQLRLPPNPPARLPTLRFADRARTRN